MDDLLKVQDVSRNVGDLLCGTANDVGDSEPSDPSDKTFTYSVLRLHCRMGVSTVFTGCDVSKYIATTLKSCLPTYICHCFAFLHQ